VAKVGCEEGREGEGTDRTNAALQFRITQVFLCEMVLRGWLKKTISFEKAQKNL